MDVTTGTPTTEPEPIAPATDRPGSDAPSAVADPAPAVSGPTRAASELPPTEPETEPGTTPRVVLGPGAPDRSSTLPFDELYALHFHPLVRLATAISGSVAVAEDVVQDAFAKLYVRRDRVDRPLAYLRRSVVNGCVSRFRRHRREDLVAAPAETTGVEHPTEADPAESDRLDLARRVSGLSPRQRAVVVLRIQHSLPEAEVAELLGCRPGTVGSLLHRALGALRIDLERSVSAERAPHSPTSDHQEGQT